MSVLGAYLSGLGTGCAGSASFRRRQPVCRLTLLPSGTTVAARIGEFPLVGATDSILAMGSSVAACIASSVGAVARQDRAG
jgi:hypothetical protein